MNLNPRGEGDMEPAALRSLDIVLGSFHSALRRKEDQTERYLAALRNPHIQILGHPRGRIYNYRLGLRADWEKVFYEAARLDKAVEIDAYPDRQDLNVSLLKIAKCCGPRISMGTDAHHPWQFEFIDLALAAALAAKIPPERIVNFMPLKELRAWVEKVRRAEARAHPHGKNAIMPNRRPACGQQEVATHPTLPRSAFLYAVMHFRAPLPKMKRKIHLYRLPFYIGLFLLIILVIIRALLPFWVRDYVNRKLSEVPEYRGHVAAVTLHLWRGAYQIHHVEIVKTTGHVPVPFFSAPLIDLSVQWRALFDGAFVGNIDFFEPKMNFVNAPSKENSQVGVDKPWPQKIKELFPLKINRFTVRNGEVHYRDFSKTPERGCDI